MKKQNIAWIQEKTKEEVEAVRDKFLQSKKNQKCWRNRKIYLL